MRRIALIACFIVLTSSCGSATSTTTAPDEAAPETTARVTAAPDCRPELFEFPPVDLDAVEYLTPFGLMTGSHVTPVDHQYFQNFKEPDRQIDVYAPADGRVTSIQRFGTPVSENPTGVVDDYRLVIEHTCTVSSVFIHITEMNARLTEYAPEIGEYASVDIAVTAGEKIGWFRMNVDYNIVDLDFTTDGLIDLSSYEVESFKPHIPDTFGYFIPEIREQIEPLSLRTTAPRGGVFAHDIDGRVVGNWFEEGTNGYGGVNKERYWASHLSFAYDHIDPSLLIISIGTYVDVSRQFAVLGNSPDPATVSIDSGPVLYQLVDWDYWVGDDRWDRGTFAEGIRALPGTGVFGSVLVELIDDRTLLVEVFPNVDGDAVDGFTSEAKRFTR